MKNYAAFVAGKLKPADAVIDSITSSKMDLMHCAVGASGEAGEVLDLIKKHVFNNREIDRQKLIEELGDVEFYLQGLRNALDIERDQIIQANVIKLDRRYRDGYSDEASLARADKSND